MISRSLAITVFALVVAALLWAGHGLLFTTFMIYDDEGYVLLSLRNYAAHGRLYDEVFSQYGPAFFALYDGLARVLRFTWDNTSARWVTLVLWAGSAGLAASLVARVARSWPAALLTFAAVFLFLWVMIHEPSHPGGLVGFLVALGAWLGCRRDPASHPPTAAALGVIGVCLLLTKINVGVFFLSSAGGWLLAHATTPALRRFSTPTVAAWCLLMPALLMLGLRDEPWVRSYALIASASGLGAWLMVTRFATPRAGARAFGAILGAATAAGIAIVIITLARGTTPAGLADGVLLAPLSHPRVYTFAFPWRPGSLAIGLLSLGAMSLAATLRGRSDWPEKLVLVLRAAALLAFVGSALGILPISLPALAMSYGAALAAALAWPLGATDPDSAEARARRWLAWLLVFQFLHAYPVAGSQINWATFLFMPLLVLSAMETARELLRRVGYKHGRLLAVAATSFSVAMAGFVSWRLCASAWSNRNGGEALAMPGAEKIEAADEIAFALRAVCQTARAHGDMLFSLPGAYSLNLWTGLPTPTFANATQWFNSLDDRRQEKIIAALRAAERPVIVVQQDVLKLLVDQGHSSDGPLSRYLRTEFSPVFRLDGYALWTRRDRPAPDPVGVARWVPASSPGKVALEIVLPALDAPPSRVELGDLRPGGRVELLSLDASNASLESTPAGPDDSLSRVHVEWRGSPPAAHKLLVSTLDAHGLRKDTVRALSNAP